MRQVIATVLLVGSIIGLILCLLFAALEVLPAYGKFQTTGDGAALGLSRFALLYLLLPLAISGLSLASLIWPWRGDSRHYVLGTGCLIGSGLCLAQAATSYISILQHTQQWYPESNLGLIATRNAVLFLPLLFAAALLMANGVKLLRAGRRRF